MNKKIFLSSPHMSDEGYEQAYIKEAFASNWIAPLGANVTGFENDLKTRSSGSWFERRSEHRKSCIAFQDRISIDIVINEQ